MTKEANDTPTPLREVLYAFSLEDRRLDADLLDEYVRRYREYAAPLTDFAIELAIDRLHDNCVPPVEAVESSRKVSPAVSRAISRFHNRLHQLTQVATEPVERAVMKTVSQAINPFSRLDRASFRGLAKSLGVNSVFLSKLRDRLIEPATIPMGFLHRLAEAVGVSVDSLKTHFAAPPQVAAQFYKAEQKPEAVSRQSFREAVESSGLTPEEQRKLLSL